MAITKNTKHENCPVRLLKGPYGPHYGKLLCSKHNRMIQWLGEQEFTQLAQYLGSYRDTQAKKTITLKAKPKAKPNGVKERPSRRKPKERELLFVHEHTTRPF